MSSIPASEPLPPFSSKCPPKTSADNITFTYCPGAAMMTCLPCPGSDGTSDTITPTDAYGNPIFCTPSEDGDGGVVCPDYKGGKCTLQYGNDHFTCANGTIGGFPGYSYGSSQDGHCKTQETFKTSDGYEINYCVDGYNCYLCHDSGSTTTHVKTPSGTSVPCTFKNSTITCPGSGGSTCVINPGDAKFSCDPAPPQQLYACDGKGNCVKSSTGVPDPKCGKGCWMCKGASVVGAKSPPQCPKTCEGCVKFFQKCSNGKCVLNGYAVGGVAAGVVVIVIAIAIFASIHKSSSSPSSSLPTQQ